MKVRPIEDYWTIRFDSREEAEKVMRVLESLKSCSLFDDRPIRAEDIVCGQTIGTPETWQCPRCLTFFGSQEELDRHILAEKETG